MYDEPFADSSQIPTHLVCRAARADVTVALSGDAGDELFGGYNRYVLGPKIWQRLSLLPVSLRLLVAKVSLAIPTAGWNQIGEFYNLLRSDGSGIASLGDKVHRVAQRLSTVRTVDELHENMVSFWTNPIDLVLCERASGEPWSLLQDPLPEVFANDAAARMMAQDIRTYLPDDILCKVDRAAMAMSLETRAPFLDPGVLAASARLPLHMKVRNGQGKWALRQILYRHVPRDLIERPKTGFGIPVGEWLRGSLRAWAEDLLSEDRLRREGLIDPVPVRQAWSEHLSGRRDWTHRLWIVLMLQAWTARIT
jgi:asparagine synthase (glutamine-hydrolysing)